MGKEIGRSYKYNQLKSSIPTLKEPVLSSLALENMCQVCYIRHKTCYGKAAAIGEQMSVCTSLGVTHVF